MITFKPVACDEQSIIRHVKLFKECFPKSADLNIEYLRWLYCENPFGPVCGFDAFDCGILVATYVCIPTKLRIYDELFEGLLSLNTATAPSYQGQGLFTKLALMTYESGLSLGYKVVYGIANQNSIHGFKRKLGFQLVCRLNARIGIGSIRPINIEIAEEIAVFKRVWAKDSLYWRSRNPKGKLRIAKSSNSILVSGATSSAIIKISCEISSISMSSFILEQELHSQFLTLYLGKMPTISQDFSKTIEIPGFMKPSPLLLIYRNLELPKEKIDPDKTLINFIDFDAY